MKYLLQGVGTAVGTVLCMTLLSRIPDQKIFLSLLEDLVENRLGIVTICLALCCVVLFSLLILFIVSDAAFKRRLVSKELTMQDMANLEGHRTKQ